MIALIEHLFNKICLSIACTWIDDFESRPLWLPNCNCMFLFLIPCLFDAIDTEVHE